MLAVASKVMLQVFPGRWFNHLGNVINQRRLRDYDDIHSAHKSWVVPPSLAWKSSMWYSVSSCSNHIIVFVV